MEKMRKKFVLMWSIFGILQFVYFFTLYDFVWYNESLAIPSFWGFHVPLLSSVAYEYDISPFILLAVFLLFAGAWIFSLFPKKSGRLFEYLVIVDPIICILLWMVAVFAGSTVDFEELYAYILKLFLLLSLYFCLRYREKSRAIFMAVWTFITLASFVLCIHTFFDVTSLMFFGFGTPLFSFVSTVAQLAFGEEGPNGAMLMICLISFFLFCVMCVVSLLSNKKFKLFEWLVVADPVIMFLIWIVGTLTNEIDSFTALVFILSKGAISTGICYFLQELNDKKQEEKFEKALYKS